MNASIQKTASDLAALRGDAKRLVNTTPDSTSIQLCIASTRAEFAGRVDEARALAVQAWQAANDDFEACVAAHYVARYQDEPQAALDWNQEALARACESYGRLREPLAAEAWFMRVLVNVCMRALRRRRVRRVVRGLWPGADRGALEDEIDPYQGADDPEALAADELLAQRAEVTRLMRALDQLPGKQRAALVLRYGHDLSVPEVAEMLGVGGGTAKTHLVRGLRRLRTVMRRSR